MSEETSAIKIEIRDVTIAYDDFVVMRGLNSKIKKAEIFVVMGLSGSGSWAPQT